MKHKYALFKTVALLLFLGITSISYAQENVTGKVTDETGSPLPGVNVLIKGTTQGTITDIDGMYSISVNEGAVLVFSFIGFATEEVIVSNSNSINVTLVPDITTLGEVVVTGFGVEREKKKLSYAVQQIAGSELARTNATNLVNSLQGKVAGVSINQGASGPTSASRIRIRGNASLSSNTQPLFVVDGVIFQPGTSGSSSWGNSDDWGNEINNLNAEDYESVTVLKGSAAAALYGSQAINGVIIIKTKKGSPEREGLGVSISQNTSFQVPYKIADFQNRFGAGRDQPDFLVADDGTVMLDNTNSNWYWSFGPEFNGQRVRDVDGRMITYSPNNDVLDVFRTGKILNSNVAIDGGNENTTFRFSYTNTQNESFVPNNKLTRNNFMLRATQKISDFLNIDASVNYALVEGKNPLEQGNINNPIFGLSYGVPRNLDVNYWANNYQADQGGRVRDDADPYGVTGIFWNLYNNNGYRDQNEIRANIDLNAQINPWLSLLLRGNVRRNAYKQTQEDLGDQVGFQGGFYSISQWADSNTRLQALLTANKELSEDLDLYFALGGETQRFDQGERSNSETSGGLRVPGQFNIANSESAPNTTVTPGESSRLDAVYAYGDLTWRNMLTLNFSARNDWDSRLTYPTATGIDNSFTYFYPSVGVAWTFSELLESPSYNWLNNAKLRASLGYTGGAPSIYATSEGNYSLVDFYTAPDGTRIPRYTFSGNTLGNLALKPLISKELEFGLNVNMLENRIGLDVTYYKKNTENQTLNLGTPLVSGVSSQQINAGNIENSGIEVLLNLTPIRKSDFSWNTSFNFARNWNKIVELAPFVDNYELDLAFGNDVRSLARVGEEYGLIVTKYGYASYQAQDEEGNPVAHPSNGKKVLQANGLYLRSVQNGEEEKVLGNALEDFRLSNLHTFQYKGIALNIQIDSKFGGMIASGTHQYGSQFGTFEGTLPGRTKELGGLEREAGNGKTYYDGIIPEGVFQNGTTKTDANGNQVDVSGMSYQEAYNQGLAEPLSAATYYNGLFSWGSGIREESVFENSWVAVREVSVSYRFPTSISTKLKLNNLRLSLIGRNLWYLYTTTKDGINPEGIFSNRAGAFAEYGGQPYVRSFGFSIDANF